MKQNNYLYIYIYMYEYAYTLRGCEALRRAVHGLSFGLSFFCVGAVRPMVAPRGSAMPTDALCCRPT